MFSLLYTDLKLLFALFDVDNSGTLTTDELKQLLQSPDPDGPTVSDEKLAEYLKQADTDSNSIVTSSFSNLSFLDSGDVSVDEFVSFITNNTPQGTYSLKSIFRTIGKSKE